MNRKIEELIYKAIERVFQSWFIEEDKRIEIMKETFKHISHIYSIISQDAQKIEYSVIDMMKLIGLDYCKVYCKGKRMSYNTLEEGVHDSLQYFIASLKENN